MIKKIEFDKETKEGYIFNVTRLYFLGILLYSTSVLTNKRVSCTLGLTWF